MADPLVGAAVDGEAGLARGREGLGDGGAERVGSGGARRLVDVLVLERVRGAAHRADDAHQQLLLLRRERRLQLEVRHLQPRREVAPAQRGRRRRRRALARGCRGCRGRSSSSSGGRDEAERDVARDGDRVADLPGAVAADEREDRALVRLRRRVRHDSQDHVEAPPALDPLARVDSVHSDAKKEERQ